MLVTAPICIQSTPNNSNLKGNLKKFELLRAQRKYLGVKKKQFLPQGEHFKHS